MTLRDPFTHRGCRIVLSVDGDKRTRFHINGPYTQGYASREEAYDAIDALIDNQGDEHEAIAATALPAGH